MRYCMVTTFFGPHSFGGDAAYVDRLARALLRRGHEVHVAYCVDAFEAVRGDHPLRPYEPPAGLHLHPLKSRWGLGSALFTQSTGFPGPKAGPLRELLEDPATDVVHFHNISLVGGPGVLNYGRHATRLMTAHEHWLVCPMHLLWKNDSKACDGPTCVRCMLKGHRPPQAWRATNLIERGLSELDALLFPSRHTLKVHQERGIQAQQMLHLPYFLPDDWSGGLEEEDVEPQERPYLAAAGRLVKMKGFQRLIPLMKWLPEIDLRLAGTGPYEPELRRLARDLPNVHFEGLMSGQHLAKLFHGARAVVVPSLFPETFGYVVLESFAVRTPVVVHLGGGALEETGVESGGGLGYQSDAELLLALRRIVHDPDLREDLADRGFRIRTTDWSETSHIDRYLSLIHSIRARRSGSQGDGAVAATSSPHRAIRQASLRASSPLEAS